MDKLPKEFMSTKDTYYAALNINSTNIFQFLVIFAQNLAILPQKPEVRHFPEVYQTFSHF